MARGSSGPYHRRMGAIPNSSARPQATRFRRRHRSLTWVGILLGGLPTFSLAQTLEAPTATLEGQVFAEALVPLALAQISIPSLGLTGVSDSLGAFRLESIPPGAWQVRVARSGYLPMEFPIQLEPAQSVWISMELDTSSVIPVEGIDARGTRALPQELTEFHERRRQGNGYFFTRSEIEAARPSRLTDLFIRLPGIEVVEVTGPFGSSQEVRFRRATGASGRGACRVGYAVNGTAFPVATDIGINSFIRPEDVAAVEVYSGSSRIPARFNTSAGSGRCGLILIWLYAGGG
jgi:hypothetical protein